MEGDRKTKKIWGCISEEDGSCEKKKKEERGEKGIGG